LSLVSLDSFNVFLENSRNVVTRKNNIPPSLDFQNVQNNRKEQEMGHGWHVHRNYELYAPVTCCGLRIFQYLGPHEGYIEDDEKTNIYVGMHVDGFRNLNSICGSQRSKSGFASAQVGAATTSTAKMGGGDELNRGGQTGGVTAVPL
jgi:hypothetical protein